MSHQMFSKHTEIFDFYLMFNMKKKDSNNFQVFKILNRFNIRNTLLHHISRLYFILLVFIYGMDYTSLFFNLRMYKVINLQIYK